MLYLNLLLLIIIANGVPIIANLLFDKRFDHPLDAGRNFIDGKPLFGPSKTIRGIIFSVFITGFAAVLMGLTWKIGLLFGIGAMSGDLFSSFIKRRLGLVSSSMAPGLDQIPESLFPLVIVSPLVGLQWQQILLLVISFIVIEISLSRLLYRLKIRKKPY